MCVLAWGDTYIVSRRNVFMHRPGEGEVWGGGEGELGGGVGGGGMGWGGGGARGWGGRGS